MRLRLALCMYIISFVGAAEWQTYTIMSGSPPPSESNVDSKPAVPAGFSPFLDKVPIKQQLLEVTSQTSSCYTFKSMMKIVRGILSYLNENPNKINYLHHLISFMKDDDENRRDGYDPKQFGEVISIIERDETLPYQEKKVLRELLNIDLPNHDLKTKIVFQYELPSLNQPHCKSVFMKLIESAHDTYMQMAKYPTCQEEYDGNYQPSNKDQPGPPKGDVNIPKPINDNQLINIFGGLEPGDNNNLNKPIKNPDDDYSAKIQLIIDKLKENSHGNTPDKINEIINSILVTWNEKSNDVKPSDNWRNIYLDGTPIPNGNNYGPNPFQIIETTTKNSISVDPSSAPINPHSDTSINELLRYLMPLLTQGHDNLLQNPKFMEAILTIIKSNDYNVTYSKMIALLELLQNSNAAHMTPKLIEIILPLLIKTKNAPDPKVIQIIIPLLRQKTHADNNPKMIELILALLKLSKEDVSKEKYRALFSLLNPNENGELNPKLIEILILLLKCNENSTPNDKIIQILVSFLNLDNGNPKNIDSLLYLLKLNNNHKLPDDLYYKIVQYLINTNMNKNVVSDVNSINFYYPINRPQQPLQVDEKLQALLFAKNPYLFQKLLPSHNAVMPNQLNPNAPGVIELTYLLKHPKPFVYEPFYYVKYKLPLPKFVTNVRNLLLKNPHLTSNPAQLYQKLITIANVTDISPNLKGYSKDDILKLTFNNGALVKTKIVDDKSINFKEQIKLLQDMNSEVLPESLLEQSQHILNGKEVKDETHKLEDLWSIINTGNMKSSVTNVGTAQAAELKNLHFPVYDNVLNVGESNAGQTDVIWPDNSLRQLGQYIKKE